MWIGSPWLVDQVGGEQAPEVVAGERVFGELRVLLGDPVADPPQHLGHGVFAHDFVALADPPLEQERLGRTGDALGRIVPSG